MILAGDYIETGIGVTLGISTMAVRRSDARGGGTDRYIDRHTRGPDVLEPLRFWIETTLARSSHWLVQPPRLQAAALGVLVADVLGLSVGEFIERVRALFFYWREEKGRKRRRGRGRGRGALPRYCDMTCA
jgi:hypothetical protein